MLATRSLGLLGLTEDNYNKKDKCIQITIQSTDTIGTGQSEWCLHYRDSFVHKSSFWDSIKCPDVSKLQRFQSSTVHVHEIIKHHLTRHHYIIYSTFHSMDNIELTCFIATNCRFFAVDL